MWQTIKNSFKSKEVRTKILFTLLLVAIYRLGSFIPVPGIDVAVISGAVTGNTFLGIISAINGGALANGTLFAIGISPYINASIILQLLTVAIPPLERLSRQGDEGRKKLTQITRIFTVILAAIQAVGILVAFNAQGVLNTELISAEFSVPTWALFIFVSLILIAGATLCMWIGERITEYGVSNGMSLLIFVGILATAGNAIVAAIKGVIEGGFNAGGWELLGFLAMAVIIFAFIVFVDKAERKITVQYAKQIKGNKMYGGQNTTIPVRVNGSGVLPLIFAFALTSFPEMLFNTFWAGQDWVTWYTVNMGTSSWLYPIMLTIFIFLFAFFYQQVQFNPIEVSKNIQNNGGFIPGIRPGQPTADYLTKVIQRITFFGALFLAIIAFVPSILFQIVGAGNLGLLNTFTSTGLLIVVNVALEFDKALEQQLMMKYYKGFLNK
ncbi:MAG: preprotein translocase subunit SecY [Clostridia bacterium]|nr:preprotein translocase subunit SecY [Clostridia bacterium]